MEKIQKFLKKCGLKECEIKEIQDAERILIN